MKVCEHTKLISHQVEVKSITNNIIYKDYQLDTAIVDSLSFLIKYLRISKVIELNLVDLFNKYYSVLSCAICV